MFTWVADIQAELRNQPIGERRGTFFRHGVVACYVWNGLEGTRPHLSLRWWESFDSLYCFRLIFFYEFLSFLVDATSSLFCTKLWGMAANPVLSPAFFCTQTEANHSVAQTTVRQLFPSLLNRPWSRALSVCEGDIFITGQFGKRFAIWDERHASAS